MIIAPEEYNNIVAEEPTEIFDTVNDNQNYDFVYDDLVDYSYEEVSFDIPQEGFDLNNEYLIWCGFPTDEDSLTFNEIIPDDEIIYYTTVNMPENTPQDEITTQEYLFDDVNNIDNNMYSNIICDNVFVYDGFWSGVAIEDNLVWSNTFKNDIPTEKPIVPFVGDVAYYDAFYLNDELSDPWKKTVTASELILNNSNETAVIIDNDNDVI
jgi:hypothetical protein